MRLYEFIDETVIKLSGSSDKAKAWIKKVYDLYPQTWQNNHVMPMGGQGNDQQFAMFEPEWRTKYKAETEHILDYIEKNRALSGTHQKLIELIRNKLQELQAVDENFDDGKNPGRKGLSQRVGIPKNATVSQLEKHANAPGEEGRMARWQLNMRRGRNK